MSGEQGVFFKWVTSTELFAQGLSVPHSYYKPHPYKDAYILMTNSDEKGTVTEPSSVEPVATPEPTKPKAVSLRQHVTELFGEGRFPNHGLSQVLKKGRRTREHVINDTKVYSALIAGRRFAEVHDATDAGRNKAEVVGNCSCASCRELAEGTRAALQGAIEGLCVGLADRHHNVASGRALNLKTDKMFLATGFSCAKGWLVNMGKLGKVLGIKEPLTPAGAKIFLPYMQAAYWLSTRYSFQWCSDVPTADTIPMWANAGEVKSALEKQIKGLHECQILSVYPTWLRYLSDGDQYQKHILRWVPPVTTTERYCCPLLYDGLAWAVWLAIDEVPLSERVFLTPDLTTFIACDSCLRDAQSDKVKGIDLYSPYSEAKMNLLQWCTGPGISRSHRVVGRPKNSSKTLNLGSVHANSFENIKAALSVKALCDIKKPLKPLRLKLVGKLKRSASFVVQYGTTMYWANDAWLTEEDARSLGSRVFRLSSDRVQSALIHASGNVDNLSMAGTTYRFALHGATRVFLFKHPLPTLDL